MLGVIFEVSANAFILREAGDTLQQKKDLNGPLYRVIERSNISNLLYTMSFINLCSRGKLKEAQDLWITRKDGPSPIDIHAESDDALCFFQGPS